MLQTYTWKCDSCNLLITKYTQQVETWTCVNCAAKQSKQSHSREPEPAVTTASNPFTDTPESPKSSRHVQPLLNPGVEERLRMMLFSIPLNALITLLEGAGGSLVMEQQEATAYRSEIVTCDWVTNKGETRLVVELHEGKPIPEPAYPTNPCSIREPHTPHEWKGDLTGATYYCKGNGRGL